MTKDGIREKVSKDLRKTFNAVLSEPIPADMQALLDQMK